MSIFGAPDVEKMKAKRDVKGLIKALEYKKDVAIPQRAALALGEIGDAQAINPLILAMDNNDKEISLAAINALGQIGVPAIGPLSAVLANKPMDGYDPVSDKCYRGTIKALGKIGGERAADAIITFSKPLVRGSRQDNELINTVVKALITILRKNAGLQKGWNALEKIGSPAIQPLIAALGYSGIDLRIKVGETLAKLGWKAPDNATIAPLIEMLNLPDQPNRQRALEVLEKLGWKPANDKEKAQYYITMGQWELCAALGQPAVAPLIKALQDEQIREHAAGALVKIKEQAIDPLKALLAHGDEQVRKAAAEALGTIGSARVVKPLIATLGDRAWGVRLTAAKALVSIYHGAELDSKMRQLILAHRSKIVQPHMDIPWKGCADQGSDRDDGIGVDFPL